MKVKLIKSGIGKSKRVKGTLKALKLTKMNKEITVDINNKALVGMVERVRHLVWVGKKS